MNQLSKWIVSHPKLIIAATIAVTAASAVTLIRRRVSFDFSLETLAQSDGDLAFYREIKRSFGDDRVIIAAFTTREVFEPEFIARLDRLTSKLASTRGVSEVQSLTNAKAVTRASNEVVVGRLIPQNASSAELKGLEPAVTSDPLYVGNLVSADGRTAAINVFIEPGDEAEMRSIADEIERIARSESAGELLLAGVPVMDSRGIRGLVRDFLVSSPIAATLCLLVFLVSFRSVWGALLPLVSLAMGLVWVMALMSLVGRPITIATVSLPTVLVAVGSSYIFHVLNQHRISILEATGTDRASGWIGGLEFIGPAVLVSGLTTAAGFGALASSSIPAVRHMGVFNAAGVLGMLVLAVTFVPAALSLLPRGALSSGALQHTRRLNRLLQNITAVVLFKRRAIWVATIGLTLILACGLVRLRVESNYLRVFPKGSDTVRSAELLHERLAGAAVLLVVVSGPAGAALEPSFLQQVRGLADFARGQDGVDATVSIADVIARISRNLYGRDTPTARDEVETLFRDFLSGERAIRRLVAPDLSRAVVVLRTHLFSSSELNRLKAALSEWAATNLPAELSVRITGSAVLLNSASDALARSQSLSLCIALAAIYLMMVVLFRSLATAGLALLPNLLPVVGYFGFLGWSGITLDITTSLIATAVLGLAVDNAVHMIRRYRQSAAVASDPGWTMWLTMLKTGKPTIITNLMLIAAFLVFVLFSFVPVRIGGLLWAVTIAACLAANVMFLPVLVGGRKRDTKPN